MALRTDLNIVQLPNTLPNVGGLTGKNTIVTDPDFGTQIVRLTDSTSGLGDNHSLQTNDDANTILWNTDDTMFALKRTGGGPIFIFQFNPSTLQGTQLSGSYGGNLIFSRVSNNIAYNISPTGAPDTQVNKLTFTQTGGVWGLTSTVTLCDFATILPGGFVANWVSEFNGDLTDTVFAAGFSTGAQDSGFYACIYKVGSGFRMVNTQTGAVTGAWGSTGTWNNTSLDATFHIHEVYQTPNAEFCVINPIPTGGNIIWDVPTLNFTSVNLSGHQARGYLDIYDGGPGGGQWAAAAYATPGSTFNIMPLAKLPAGQTPPQTYAGDQHGAFGLVSVTDASIFWVVPGGSRSVYPLTSCWESEVHGYVTNGTAQTGTVYRACHTFNSNKSKEFVPANAIGVPSQTGNFVAFTSDWAGSGTIGPLGSTSGAPTGTVGVDARADVFIVAIPTGNVAPTITSGNNVTFTQGTFGSFTVTTTGSPTPAITESGSLPSGVTFVDNGNATATLSGTPTASGTFPLTITATNSAGTANQPFTLTVNATIPPVAPNITSANSATFTNGVFGSFTVNTTGTPTPSIAESGSLPSGISFVDNGNGTGTLSGTSSALGNFNLTFTASNGTPPNAVQPFTLTMSPSTPLGTVTATFLYGNGSPVANGVYQWKLTADALDQTIACMVPSIIGGTLDANGNMSATLVFNDQLLTATGYTTKYQLTVDAPNGPQVWNETYQLTGTAANLNLIPPSGH